MAAHSEHTSVEGHDEEEEAEEEEEEEEEGEQGEQSKAGGVRGRSYRRTQTCASTTAE